MRVSIILSLVVIGLATANRAFGRAPPPIVESNPPGRQLWDAVIDGIRNWGLNGELKPPASRKAPLQKMPLGLGLPKPPPKSRPDPSIKTGVTRVPGQPLGPQKCRPCRHKKRQLCCNAPSNSKKGSEPQIKGPSKAYSGHKPYEATKMRASKAGVVKATAIAVLAPQAKGLLEDIKQWDNPVGEAVGWFDNAIAFVQEAIGGPLRGDIDGNDLKAKLICALKGGVATENIAGRKNKICTSTADEFKEDLEAAFKQGKIDERIKNCKGVNIYQGGNRHVWEWAKRYCAALHRSNRYAERIWEIGLNGLLDSCSELETNPPENTNLRTRLEARCTAFRKEVDVTRSHRGLRVI